MAPSAKRLFVAFYNDHAKEQCEMNADLAAAWAKAEGYAARLALLCEVLANPQSTAVSDVSMLAGISLARWFVDEAARIYADLGGESENSEARAKRELARLAEWIHSRGGHATVRDLTRGPRKYRGDVDTAEADLTRLVDAGFGAWRNESSSDSGGRPTRVFVLAQGGDGDTTSTNAENSEVLSPSPTSPIPETTNRDRITI